ncbi:MAG: monooxygenase [Myxococcales bacterium]|nr:monooxygenase [Myxococcales bacterium]
MPARRLRPSWLALLACGLAPVACIFQPLPEDLGVCEEAPEDLAPKTGVTYYKDVKPLLDASCVSCHQDGGIAPFALTTYDDAYAARGLIGHATAARTMPPWPPSDCCAEYVHDRSLSLDEIAMIAGWVEDDGPAGDPADEPPPLSTPPGLSRVDLELEMPEAYSPAPGLYNGDDLRCFLIDWPETELRYVTGLDVHPGNRDLVHHAVVYAVSSTSASLYKSYDDASAEPGWSCPGGLAEGSDTVLGLWVPGTDGFDFPAGLGRPVEPGSTVVLSVHYRPSQDGASTSDQTAVAFKLDDAVDTVVRPYAVYNPAWPLGGMAIPAGAEDQVFTYAYDPTLLSGGPLLIHNAQLHMHEYGASAALAIERADGSLDCLLAIEDWDYNWQGEYYFKEPIRLEQGDKLKVECHFDNSAANQQSGEEPKPLNWADDKEMCIGTVLVSDI